MACDSVLYWAGSEADVGGVCNFGSINDRFGPALLVLDGACASAITGRGFFLRVVILQDPVIVICNYCLH